MARGKSTQTGLGDTNPNRSTRMGLRVERKKIVTKRGLVAPSPEDPERLEEFVPESDRKGRTSDIVRKNAQPDAALSESKGVYEKSTDPLGMTPPPPLDQMQLEESDVPESEEVRRNRSREIATDPRGFSPPVPEAEDIVPRSDRMAAHEDITPAEGSELDEAEDRSRFRTAPGGGRNRISGGREHAKAYVSPITLKPSTPSPPPTGPVKVLDVVENAVRAYQTEPSLLKRRLSSLPPPLPQEQRRTHLLVGGVAVGVILAGMVLWGMLRARQSVDSGSVADRAGEDQPTKKVAGQAAPDGVEVSPAKKSNSTALTEPTQTSAKDSGVEALPKASTQHVAQKKAAGSASNRDDVSAKAKAPATKATEKKIAQKSAASTPEPRSAEPTSAKSATPGAAATPSVKSAPSAEGAAKSGQDLWLE